MSEVGQAFADTLAEIERHTTCVIGQANVRVDVRVENQRQLGKWGVQTHDPTFWFAILLEEVGEVAEALLPGAEATIGMNAIATTLLRDAIHLGREAKRALEGEKEDRINFTTHAPDVGKETIQVAAVAVAMEESRRRTANA